MVDTSAPQGIAGAPNEAALLALMERTGYSMIQINGQRKYGGPPPNWDPEIPAPPRGCEVFVGKIPRDCYEDELVPVFEKMGHIYELRLMMDFSGSNRGYCFVMYTSKGDAKRAVKELNNYEIRPKRFLGVCLSVDNCRLFVGGIPKDKTKEEILAEMVKVTEGVTDVIVYPSATDKTKNRGFAFVEYDSHKAAAMARRKLIPGKITLWSHQIAVDWAEPEQEVDEEIMEKVKILYVRNLMMSTSEETIEATFNQVCGKDNAVERVKKIRDYAFVHFRERQDATTSMHVMNGNQLEGSVLEITLAKPVDKNEYVRFTRTPGKDGVLAQPAAFAASPFLNPALQYANPATAAAMSTLMQDRLRQSPIRGRGRGAAGSRGAGGVGRGYMPSRYQRTDRRAPGQDRLFDLVPGMELTPTNPITLKPHNNKQPPQILEEFCRKNGWETPVYELHSTNTMGARGDGHAMQLFLYKVSIPGLVSPYQVSSFTPNKLCPTLEEAKNYAASYVLAHLGVPVEAAEMSNSSTPTAVSPIPVSSPMSVSPAQAATIYQGRPLAAAGATAAAAATYNPLANGASAIAAAAALQQRASEMTFATSVPLATATALTSPASYVVASRNPQPQSYAGFQYQAW